MNHSNNKIPDHIYIVGAGGITTYFLPAFIKTMTATTKDLSKRRDLPDFAAIKSHARTRAHSESVRETDKRLPRFRTQCL